MKKKADAYGDLDFRMYPFSSYSLRNFWSASSSSAIVGIILQSIALGAPSLSLMAWSHGLDGGNQWASSSLKTFQCFWYSFGVSTLSWYCWASCASLLDIVVFREHSSSRFSTIWTLSCSDRGSEMVRDMVLRSSFLWPYYMQIHRTALFPLSPIPSQGLMNFHNLILLIQFDLVTSFPVRYLSGVVIWSCLLSCTIYISEPLVQLLVVLGEFRFLST